MHIVSKAALAAAAFLAPLAPSAAAPAKPAAEAAAPTRFTVTVEGAGPDVILIPGLSSPREVWAGTVAALRGDYRLHLVQLNGFGGTPAGANAAGDILPGTIAELRRYIEANHLRRPALVGHSMGGLLALMLAEAAPDQVGRVMAVDALPFIGSLFDPAATAASLAPQAAAMRDMMATPATDEQRAAGAARVAAGLAKTPAARDLVARWIVASDPKISGEAVYEDMTTDVRPGLGKIAAPVRVVYAWDVTSVPEARAKALFEGAYAGTPHVSFAPVEGSYHFVMLDQPERFQAALRAFLAEKP
ncbi:MAG TPA: alpha/beta hydrolase [Allosphingosinicella sp.]|jgi:pimeloyl-ACP methyl ester carboxylesterase